MVNAKTIDQTHNLICRQHSALKPENYLYLKGYNSARNKKSYPKRYTMNTSKFVKDKRKKLKLSQTELAMRVHVGLRFIRELEQGKKTLRMDKVNQVLNFLGYELGPVETETEDA